MEPERLIIIPGDDRPKPTGFWRGNGEWHELFQPAAAPEGETAPPAQLAAPQPGDTVEICRSFSYKMNLTKFGRDYESADFFCSRKLSCYREEASTVSQLIFEECVDEIRDSMQAFASSLRAPRAPQPPAESPRTHPSREVAYRR